MEMEGTCMELALEGERLCKAGDCRSGVQFFEAAVQVGTDDLKTLSAIYSQLGNAYFYLQEYAKALEYHKHDLNLARTLSDRLGEAKASGNLGNTLKVLGKFDEAIACCEHHLNISRELTDKIGEARALYNLGNVYHAKGKHAGRTALQDPGEFPPEVKEALQKAAEYYEFNLEIVRDLSDRAAQGRACGNLGNTHYLLGNFGQAIVYHEERLAIAKEFGDKSAERRAYSNLGNAHIFLGEFEVAAEHYKKTLQIAKELGDRALEAQACYSLGNTYTLLRDYEQAIGFHLRHLQIAQELNDRVGEGRACWSLGNAHTALGSHEKALQFASKHLQISKEIGDQTGQVTAQMNLTDLRTLLGIVENKAGELDSNSINTDRSSVSSSVTAEIESGDVPANMSSKVKPWQNRSRRLSMENLELMKLTPEKQAEMRAKNATKLKTPRLQKAASVATDVPHSVNENTGKSSASRPNTAEPQAKKLASDIGDDDAFFDLLSKFQSRRIDDQRCSFRVLENNTPAQQRALGGAAAACAAPGPPIGAYPKADMDFLDMVAGIQGSRMNDQRVEMNEFPGLHNSNEVLDKIRQNKKDDNSLDDGFFEMLMKCQGSRIDDQRSSLPERQSAPTVPDEDFFSLIQRVQSNRLDEQRSALPKSKRPGSGGKKYKDKKDKEK